MDELLVKYLLKDASSEEFTQVEAWISATTGNRRYYEQFKRIWTTSNTLAEQSTVDEDAAWQRLQQRIASGGKPVLGTSAQQIDLVDEPVAKIKTIYNWRSVAAVLLLACTGWLSVLLYQQMAAQTMQTLAARTAPIAKTLADGSVVTLNKSSTLQYPTGFSGKNRSVQLTGEAFFSVAKNPEKPFTVEVGNLIVTVLGTSFNIKESPQQTEVVVETGLVSVSDGTKSLQLKAGERALLSGESSSWKVVSSSDKLHQYYRTKTFNCDNTPLWKLVEVLNSAYDVSIEISNPSIRNLPITTVFEERPINEVLFIIEQTLDVTVTRNGGKIFIQ